jgi:amino acid transporter
MSEREGSKGNTDAPRVDTKYGERRADDRGESGPRRVKEIRAERGSEYGPADADERGTSWGSVIIGWLAALGAGLILSGIVSGIAGAIFGVAGRQGIQEGGAIALIGLLISLLLAFLIGGYTAGRMAARSGLKHGLLVPLLALVVTLVLAIVGGLLGVSFVDQLTGITLPQGAQQQAPQNLGTILSVSGLLALLFPFIGGAIGGAWGARTGSHRP